MPAPLLAGLLLTPAEPTEPLSPGQRRRVVLGAATLTTGMTAGGLAIVSRYEHDRYFDEGTRPEDRDAIERRANLTGGLAVASGVAAVGLGCALVLTW